jgi:hypothetical protein
MRLLLLHRHLHFERFDLNWAVKLSLLAFLFLFGIVHCTADDGLQKTVDHLISTVETSKCTFIRNGSDHTPKEAAEHMRKKYNYYKKEIRTPEDFIAKCATKSELSGKPYMVKFPDGKTQKCEEWLRSLLKESKPVS